MELEAGLGIDSIKRVEILSSLQDQIPHVGEMDTAELAELNTLGEIIDFVSGGNAAAVDEEPLRAAMTRYEVAAESRPPAGIALGQIEQAAPLYLVGDRTGVAERLAGLLTAAGVKSAVTDLVPEDARWFVLFTGLNAGKNATVQECMDLNTEAFEQVRRCAASMADSGRLLVTVQATGGDFGLSGSNASAAQNAWSTGIAALAKTASREWKDVAVKAIDIDAGEMSVERVAQELFGEIIAGGPELEVGLKLDGDRITLVAQNTVTPSEPAEMGDDCVIVCSGGARGVTAACLQELLDRRPVKLAILGRTPLTDEPAALAGFSTDAELKKELLSQHTQAGRKVTPIELNREVSQLLNMREVRANLAQLTSTGSQVIYLPTDISDAASVAASVARVRDEMGPVTVVVHAAGVLADKEIHKKTDEQFHLVFQTKVAGLKNLLDATSGDPLTHLVCFSSVAARTGNTGQVDYAMANEVLNRVCQQQQITRGAEFSARSIGWGPWAGGMVDPGLAGHFRAQGVELIPLSDGAALFADEIEGRNGDCVEIVYGGGLGIGSQDDGNKGERISHMAIRVHVSEHPQISSHLIQDQPVVPLTLVNEWGMSIAAALNPSAGIVGVRDLNVLKGIQLAAFETTGDWLTINCERSESGDLLNMAVMSSEGIAHYKLAIQLGDKLDVQGAIKKLPEPEARDVMKLDDWEWTPKRIYEEFLFHGEKLQVVKQLLGVSEGGCRALLQMPDESDLARWRVAMLDGGLQLALLWERKRSGLASLPTKFGEMNWHHAALPEGPVTCELILKKATKLAATWSIVFTNVEKQIIATMEDVSIHVLATA
jgi:NAD(P)-dependent dehydrogenase (short-subunit alcohol dehydrogenase family)